MESSLLNYLSIVPLILANIFWYFAKVFIRNNGLKSAPFWNHMRDFKELKKLMSADYSEETNIKAKIYYFGVPIVGIAAIILFFAIAGTMR